MRALHIGLVCSNEPDADRFYRDLLGLTRQEPKTIPESIVNPLFGYNGTLTVINYTGSDLHVEVFITDTSRFATERISHTCLEVDNPEELLDRAASSGFAVSRIPKGNGHVLFLDDPDGNRFEIKQSISG